MKRLMVDLLALAAGVLCSTDGFAATQGVDEMIDKYLCAKTWSEGRNEVGGKVIRDGRCITAAGMGVAMEFGLEIVSVLKSPALAGQIRAAIQAP